MKFSIICLTYKRPELLEESVFSVLQQTYQDFELLIINDYPLQRIKFDHPKVRIFNLDNKIETIGEKRNFGVKNAIGDLILQLDDDDLFLPEYLENLNNSIKHYDWLSNQKPIMYYNDHNKIHLSPVPLTNTFLYRRETIGNKVHYNNINYDELTPLYSTVIKGSGSGIFMLLKPEMCGYVYRQDINEKRKYSMVEFKSESIATQTEILNSIDAGLLGDINLNPKWNEDYISIIKKNCKFPTIPKRPEQSGKQIDVQVALVKKKEDEWKSVKFTWENAMKFVDSINSRGIVPAISDILGINKTLGERVSDEMYKLRKLSCFGDKIKNIDPCVNLKNNENTGYFCGACGCGNNPLAKLNANDSLEYTKLHYPDLQCPLKRPGFSNSENFIQIPSEIPLSIIIPVLNDNEELNLTIKSIRETSPSNIEIIVIDDTSDIPVIIDDKNVKLFRFDNRRGAGQARHFGAMNASSKHLLFIDSHMRFDKNWFTNALSRMLPTPKTLWCGTCLGLDAANMDIDKPYGAYNGADLVLYAEKNKTIFDGVWRDEDKDKDDYEISCVMGACYFIHKEWYFHIKGLEQTMMWGSEEPILSIKSWLSGGEVRLMKSVKLGHKFRNISPYSTSISHIHYNKLAYAYMIFPNDMYNKLIEKFPKDGNTQIALNMIQQYKHKLDIEKEYYKSIFKYDIYWLCEKFSIEIPS